MRISTKVRTGWMERPRKGSQYWSGHDAAKGWCIFSRPDGYHVQETGRTYVGVCGAVPEQYPKKSYGPFESFEAAKAAFVIMHDI